MRYSEIYISENFDEDSNGTLSEEEINNITGIYVYDMGINSLNGIEFFIELTHLFCDYNQLTELDVSKNTALTDLRCECNQLTELDVSRNTVLTLLYCNGNQLTELDISKNTALNLFTCGDNQLTELDVSKNTA